MNSPTTANPGLASGVSNDPVLQEQVFARLVQGFLRSAGEPVEQRWSWLMAAHIVGQTRLGSHLHSHVLMLRFALRLRAGGEAAGQLFRLMLVPVGHVIGRLPIGNIGRATVNAFAPMPVSPELARLISEASAAVQRP